MLMTKQELTIEVAQVDSVQINDGDLSEPGRSKASQDEILQKFTTDATSADHKNFRLDNPD